MAMTWLWVIVCVTAVSATAERGGSSLRGALEALQRRQRGRMHGPILQQPDYESLYEFVPPQGYPDSDYELVDDAEEQPNPKYFIKLLDDNERPPEAYEYTIIKKKNSHFNSANPNKQESAFRERAHANNEQLRDLFLDKVEPEEKEPVVNDKDAEYAVLLSQLWSKYKHDKARVNSEENSPRGPTAYKEKVVMKRYPDNWGPIAFKRKRSSDPDIDRSVLPDYEERKHEPGSLDPNYNRYDLNDDDKDEFKEEYAIAFQPLDDDTLPDLGDDDAYTYDNVEKRFPVAKRSSGPYDFSVNKKSPGQNKREASRQFKKNSGTDPKILKDLSIIFGDSNTDFIKSPVKRSSDQIGDIHTHEGKPPLLPLLHPDNHTHDQNNSRIVEEDDSHEHHGHNIHHPGFSGKEEEIEHGNANHRDHDHKQEEKPINIKKKSIDWSDYFGIDKRKKTVGLVEDLAQERLRKPYLEKFNKEVIYPLNSFRSHNFAKRNFIKPNSKQDDIQTDHTEGANENKRSGADDKNSNLDNFDKKLKNMEGFIVDEALQFSNGGEKLDSKEEQEMKEKLLSRLAAAYSLEKMRKALKEFKQSLQTPKGDPNTDPSLDTEDSKAKRVAVKKELLNNEIPLSNNAYDRLEDFEDEQGAGHYLNGKVEEQFSEGYMGGSGRHRLPAVPTVSGAGSCPVLTKIIERCRNVDLLAGDRGQLFLPLCSLHQICYLCGEAPPTTCDLVFLSEADTTCEGDMSCQRAARSALMALRELHDNLADELDGECEASPCLPAALKLNTGWQRALNR